MSRRTKDYRLLELPETTRGLSPYRLVDREGQEIKEINEFLDSEATRGLSPRSLRTYGYSLLHFWRWFATLKIALSELSGSQVFSDYVRFQRQSLPEPAPSTINHRLTAVSSLYRFHFGRDLEQRTSPLSHPYHSSVSAPSGYLYPVRRRARRRRLKSPRRVVVPLRGTEVRSFLESFSTWRDLSIVSLMLLCGLRSREVIELRLGDLDFSLGQIRVRGKGDKERMVPLPNEVIRLLQSYLELERPVTAAETLFASLKGKRRAQPMTAAGLRSLFRHHRRVSGILKANPHRFRHTFGSELAAAGISLAALKKLMGHSDINTTLRYVELSVNDVREEFLRLLRLRSHKQSEDDGRGEAQA